MPGQEEEVSNGAHRRRSRRPRGHRPGHRHRHPRRPRRPRRSAATPTQPARSAASRSSSRRSPKASASSRSSSACWRSSSRPERVADGSERPSWTSWRSRPASGRRLPVCCRCRGRGAVPDQPVPGDHRGDQLRGVPRDHLDVRVQAGPSGCWPTARTRIEQGLRDAEQARQDRESRRGRAAGRPPGGAARGERHPRPGPEGRRRDRASATSPRPARSSSGSAPRATRRHRGGEAARDRASCGREVADLALRAAGRVVGETMNDERQRRLVDEFLAEAGSGSRRIAPADGARATARRGATPRPPSRSRTATARSRRGGADLDERRAACSDGSELMAVLANPALPLEQRTEVARQVFEGLSATGPEPRAAPGPARPDRAAAAGRRGVPPARTTAARGSSDATATSAAPLDDTEVRALDGPPRADDRRHDRARDRRRPEPPRRLDRPRRRPTDRRQRPGPPRAAAEPARLGAPA